ncbi:MAG TPA: glycosyl hydrolase [Phycisphaerae bacterium]|nr:glycosyl hydrolase [Phycisphaerae bacterium]
MDVSKAPALENLGPALDRVFELAARKIVDLDKSWDAARGTPVFTVEGRYTTRGWTEWTQGFQFGMAILAFDATRDEKLLMLGRDRTFQRMAPHVSHIGVHDHGFNNISTYGNLRRLMREGVIPHDGYELSFYEMALKVSGAVQAARWTPIFSNPEQPTNRDTGYIHSFNGPHSLFSDTIRSLRSLCLAWQLGHALMAENDRPVNLLHRAIHHALTTAKYNVYYGAGRDSYDKPQERGRTVHESIFNTTDGRYRCPSTQQGYSPFSTWTRGLAWILCGFAEQLEFLQSVPDVEFTRGGFDPEKIVEVYQGAAIATADWYLAHSFPDGMVYWDAGAPGIPREESYLQNRDPYSASEPLDSSAAAIAAQGFLRLANYLEKIDRTRSERYAAAARLVAHTLFSEPYLATDKSHQGLVLHSIYHRPNGWDHIPRGRKIPCGESSMWGDYHALELALLLRRQLKGEAYITFFDR